MNLPKEWKNFRIVETSDGTFTGQIFVDDISKEIDWDNKGRKKLAKYTKQYLEKLLGYKIKKYDTVSMLDVS